MLNYVGQLGPLLGVHLYPDSDQPFYVRGMAVCAGFMAAVAVLAFGLRWILGAQNRKVGVGESEDDGAGEGLVAQRVKRQGVKRVEFMM